MQLPNTLRVVEATSWRIILEEETGGPSGRLFQITPEANEGFGATLIVEELKPKEVK